MTVLAVVAIGAGGVWVMRRLMALRMAARDSATAAQADVAVLGELVLLGLSAGLTFAEALESAAAHVGPALGSEVDAVLRRARAVGLAPALAGADGRARRLYRVSAEATSSGAPLLRAVAAVVDDMQHADHARRLAAARRLPVRLLVPLALLMLPGFVLLMAGPALLVAADRLRF